MLVLTSESAIQDAERKISTGRGWHTESHRICYKRKGRREERGCVKIEYATRERGRKEERKKEDVL